jgi:acyl transferase domain-containing protein
MMMGLDRGHFLSPTGQCKVFDASADGYARSEGCGLFVLKRLSDAMAEDDRVLGVIRGVEVNQGSLACSITRPYGPSQVQLFERLLRKTGVDRDRVNVVEAHGTGTRVGDPTEVESIREVFSSSQRTAGNPLHITSVKANIGHLEAASGAAGLAKVLLMFRYQAIPRQISLRELNPLIAPLAEDHTVIDKEALRWDPSHLGMTRMAVLNNFGAAGSNAAMLLEEFPKNDIHSSSDHNAMAFVFGLSAKTEVALEELRLRYVEYLESPLNGTARLCDIAYTATARRQIYPYRLAVSASNRMELVEKLRNSSVKETKGTLSRVVLVFSGQGSQYLDMGSSLYHTSSVFRMHIEHCNTILLTLGFPNILSIINPGVDGSGLTFVDEFQAYQAAVFSLEYALSQVWFSWGLKVDAVVGHRYTVCVVI